MRILMVCLGNICRSPLAEGILREMLRDTDHLVDSAGTSAFHEGERPDARTLRTARKNQISMEGITARPFTANDFDQFDRIYVMDHSNRQQVLAMAPNEDAGSKVDLLLNASYPGKELEVPDPYFGGEEGFNEVYRLIHEACTAIAKEIGQ